jgi:hypothetical protein
MSRFSFDVNSIIGKPVEEAQKIAGWSGFTLVVKIENGVQRPVQLNTSYTRILADVEKGVVKSASIS